jgi:hypothetical protein
VEIRKQTWKSRGMTKEARIIAPHKEARIATPNAHIKRIRPMATTTIDNKQIRPMATKTNEDHTKQQASTRRVRQEAHATTKGAIGNKKPHTKTMTTRLLTTRSMGATNQVTETARVMMRKTSTMPLPQMGHTT